MELIQSDRRVDRRYDIALELRYKVLARTHSGLQGTGRTSNMSSGGISFETEQLLPAGSQVELSISWPAVSRNASPILLRVMGHIVRCDQKGVAIRTDRYEFRARVLRVRQEEPEAEPRRTWLT